MENKELQMRQSLARKNNNVKVKLRVLLYVMQTMEYNEKHATERRARMRIE